MVPFASFAFSPRWGVFTSSLLLLGCSKIISKYDVVPLIPINPHVQYILWVYFFFFPEAILNATVINYGRKSRVDSE